MAKYSLAERVVVVTGAGSGIGREIARQAAESGAHVVVADIAQTAHETVELVREGGGVASPFIGDLSLEETTRALIAQAAGLGRLGGLACNAGVMDNFAGVASVETADFDRIMRVNVSGPLYLMREAIPLMIAAGGGSIVNTASAAGIRGAAAGAAYTASKHALVGLTRNTAFTYAKQGIRCNAVAPGGVVTNILQSVDRAKIDPAKGLAALTPVHASAPTQESTAAQQAALIVFLLSDEAANISGAIIPNDGGWFAG